MDFLIELFWAILVVGMPIAVFTLVLVWWALLGGHLKESMDMVALKAEMKAMSKNKKRDKKDKKDKKNAAEEKSKQHPLQRKWAKFGGGFYGIVAFFTYIIIEVSEIIGVILNMGGFIQFLKQLDLNLIIDMVIEAFTNFVAAITWPIYWMREIDTEQTWVWFLVAYGGYWVGLRAAQILIQRKVGVEK